MSPFALKDMCTRVSSSCGESTCEIYEIWSGTAFIYMQERAEDDPGRIVFDPNEAYEESELSVAVPRLYDEFGIESGVPIYRQFEVDSDQFLFVSRPREHRDLWQHFEP